MLKKNDLAKQFELVVQQEIKNYNDSLSFVLQSINELKESIKELKEDSLKTYALIHSDQGKLSIEIKSLKDACFSLALRFEKSQNDQWNVNERNSNEMLDISNAIFNRINSDNGLKHKIELVSEEIKEIKRETNRQSRFLEDGLSDLTRRVKKDILLAKEDIISRPSDAYLIKRDLEEKIASHAVDVDGIMKEIQVAKKENYVLKKQIENIYTLIARLKASEVAS